MQNYRAVFGCLFLALVIVVTGCDNTRVEVSEPKTGHAFVTDKKVIPGGSGISIRLTGGGLGSLGFGTGGIGIGLGGGLQWDLDPDPERFEIDMDFHHQSPHRYVLKKQYDQIKKGEKLTVTYREKRWVRDSKVIRTEHWIEKIE